MNRRDALAQARKTLTENNIVVASLEAEILLRHVLGLDRAWLFASLDDELTTIQLDEFMSLVTRRKNGEPSAYITGHREFYGLDFEVDPRVLIPRPETELLVEKAISLCQRYGFSKIADIGTGCGCIAVTLAVHLPDVTVYAADISSQALEVTIDNSLKHGVKNRINLLQGNLLEPLPGPVDLIAANLPYVRRTDLNAGFEPEMALDGGEEGMDKIDELCWQAQEKFNNYGMLLLEIGQGQTEAVKAIIHEYLPAAVVEVERDLAGIERVVCARLTS